MMTAKLSETELNTALDRLSNWRHETGTDAAEADAIVHDYQFKDFSEAFAFITRVALLAEKAGHHPDWSNSYNRVTIALSTHDAGGITEKDINLAWAIDRL